MSAVQGTDVIVAFKKQSALKTPASGASATGIEVRPSTGLAQQVATINSAIIRRNLMRRRPRQGSKTVSASYETELRLATMDDVFAGVLGSKTVTFTISNTDVTSAAISGTGTLVTVASGNLITLGLRNGQMGQFATMSTAGNNGKWFPILSVTATTFAVPSGYLADQSADTSFTLTIAKYFSTPTPRPVEYYTVEEYLGSAVDASKLGVDMKFDSLNFQCQPNNPATVGFSLAGLDLSAPSGVSAPNFTSPVFPTAGPSLVMLDGAIYKGTTAVASLTGFTCGIKAQSSVTPLLTSRVGSDVVLQMFDFDGQFTALVEDVSHFTAFVNETGFSLFARFSEPESDPADFVSIYAGDLTFGGWNTPIADGQMIQTLPLYGGSDANGGIGAIDSTLVISTSAA